MAAEGGHQLIVSYILGHVSNIQHTASRRIKNGTKSQPLQLCAYKGHWEIAKVLLEAGAPLMGYNAQKDTVLHIAARHGRT